MASHGSHRNKCFIFAFIIVFIFKDTKTFLKNKVYKLELLF